MQGTNSEGTADVYEQNTRQRLCSRLKKTCSIDWGWYFRVLSRHRPSITTGGSVFNGLVVRTAQAEVEARICYK